MNESVASEIHIWPQIRSGNLVVDPQVPSRLPLGELYMQWTEAGNIGYLCSRMTDQRLVGTMFICSLSVSTG